MTGKIDARLKDLGIVLPTPPAPVASYVPFVVTGKLVFVSGQVTGSNMSASSARNLRWKTARRRRGSVPSMCWRRRKLRATGTWIVSNAG